MPKAAVQESAHAAEVTAFVKSVAEPNASGRSYASPTAARRIVFIAGTRTAVRKAVRSRGASDGSTSAASADELLAVVLRQIMLTTGVAHTSVGDICVGNVLQPGGGAAMARLAAFEAGYPETVPVSATNRQCASGLQAVINIAGELSAGSISVGIAAGVECMSLEYAPTSSKLLPVVAWSSVAQNRRAAACMIPMGVTSDLVASTFGISRLDQDIFAADSHRKARDAQSAGHFRDEITQLPVGSKPRTAGKEEAFDNGIRYDCTVQALQGLKPAFAAASTAVGKSIGALGAVNATTTAGNSSQVSDGASAVMMSTLGHAVACRLPVLGALVAHKVVGVTPELMGIGPAVAIPALIKHAAALGTVGLDGVSEIALGDVGLFEINEAFASQVLYCVRYLGIPADKLNVYGGAIALGHPLGATGNRLVVTLLHAMRRRNVRYGVVSMCIGTGMGSAALLENLDYVSSPAPRGGTSVKARL